MSQVWPPTPRRAPLSLIRGVAPAGYLGPVVVLADGVVTVTGRVNNGNGLTFSSSFQQVALLPEWARPGGDVIAPATTAGTATAAVVRVRSSGELDLASSDTVAAFSVSYPL